MDSDERQEDDEARRLVARFQAGDRDAFAEIYSGWFDRVYTYLRVVFKDNPEAEDAAQQVFIRAFQALPRYESGDRPFQAWLFTIVRNLARTILTQRGQAELVELDEAGEGRTTQPVPSFLSSLDWITDADLLVFIDRLPPIQRQVLVLRFMLDLPAAEVARILDRSEGDIRVLQHRALAFLRKRLIAIGRGPSRDRARTRSPLREATVLRSRRFILS